MGDVESGKSNQDRKVGNPAVIATLAAALGAAGAAGANIAYQEHKDTVADMQTVLKGDQSFDAMRMKMAERFVTRLSKEFEKADKSGLIDEDAVNALFGGYLFEGPLSTNVAAPSPGLTPAMEVHRLEQAVLAAMQRGGIHQNAADRLLGRLDVARNTLDTQRRLTSPLLPNSPEQGLSDNGMDYYDNNETPKSSTPTPRKLEPRDGWDPTPKPDKQRDA